MLYNTYQKWNGKVVVNYQDNVKYLNSDHFEIIYIEINDLLTWSFDNITWKMNVSMKNWVTAQW